MIYMKQHIIALCFITLMASWCKSDAFYLVYHALGLSKAQF